MSANQNAPEGNVIHTHREDHTLFISMQRPTKRNAINRAMADGIDAALNELDDDEDDSNVGRMRVRVWKGL